MRQFFLSLFAGLFPAALFFPLSKGNWWRFQRWEGMMIYEDTVTQSLGKGAYQMLQVTDIDTIPIEVRQDSRGALLFSWEQFSDFVMLPSNPRVGVSWIAYRQDTILDRDGDGAPDSVRRRVLAKILSQEDVEVPAGRFPDALKVRYTTLDSLWLSQKGSWSVDTAGDTLRYWVKGVGLVILENFKIPDKFVLTDYRLR